MLWTSLISAADALSSYGTGISTRRLQISHKHDVNAVTNNLDADPRARQSNMLYGHRQHKRDNDYGWGLTWVPTSSDELNADIVEDAEHDDNEDINLLLA